MEKTARRKFIHANDLLDDSFALASQIYESGFRPDYLVGLWRGGSAVGIAVQEGLQFLGVDTDHIAIRTSYRSADDYARYSGKKKIRVHGLRYLHERICSDNSMLIVDDVYGTGSSVQAVISELARKSRRNLPSDIRVATVWYRPSAAQKTAPDYFIHQTDQWLVLPYELNGLCTDEIKQNKPGLEKLTSRLEALRCDNK